LRGEKTKKEGMGKMAWAGTADHRQLQDLTLYFLSAIQSFPLFQTVCRMARMPRFLSPGAPGSLHLLLQQIVVIFLLKGAEEKVFLVAFAGSDVKLERLKISQPSSDHRHENHVLSDQAAHCVRGDRFFRRDRSCAECDPHMESGQ
jgi:hypothetical protein